MTANADSVNASMPQKDACSDQQHGLRWKHDVCCKFLCSAGAMMTTVHAGSGESGHQCKVLASRFETVPFPTLADRQAT